MDRFGAGKKKKAANSHQGIKQNGRHMGKEGKRNFRDKQRFPSDHETPASKGRKGTRCIGLNPFHEVSLIID
jgi:hypothetical protein